MIIKRDEKGRFMASETKKQKTSGGDAVKILIRGGDAPVTVVVRT